MARKFQIKRGPAAKIPTLAQAEFGMTTDSNAEKLFLGNGSKNLEIPFLKDLNAWKIGALSSALGGNYSLNVVRGDRAFLTTNFSSSIPNVPTAGNYAYFYVTNVNGRVEVALALPMDSTNKVYLYTLSTKKWEHITSTDYAVAKTGDQVMSGGLTASHLTATDGYVDVAVLPDGVMSRAEIRATNASTGESCALLVGTDDLRWMDENSEYRVLHTGNMTQILGVMAATVE